MLKTELIIIAAFAIPIVSGGDFSSQDITVDNILKELNNAKDESYSVDLTGLDSPRSYDMQRIEIVYPYGDVDGYNVNVWCPPRDYLSSYNILSIASGTAVEVARKLFANPKIDMVHVMQQMDIGANDPIKAIQIEISRKTFEGINWDEAREQIKNDPETAFEIFEPCNIYVKGSSGYQRPARYECNS